MESKNNLSYDTKEKINGIVLNLLLNNRGYTKQDFSYSELQQLSKQMTNGTQITQEEIIGLYDGSIANSFSGNFSGILFLKDKLYVNIRKSSHSECMQYADMTSLSGDPSSFLATFVLTANDGNKIVLKGLSYTTSMVYATFYNIIKAVNDNKSTTHFENPRTVEATKAEKSHLQTYKNNDTKKEDKTEKERIYEKTTTLLLNVFKDLCGDTSFFRKEDISDKKNLKLLKEYGHQFSREKILFCDKFLVFAPSLIVTADYFRSYSFDETTVPNRIVSFKDIKRISYNLMPTETNIKIDVGKGWFRDLYNGVPRAETYSDVKSYEKAVSNGSYKSRTICYLATIYALTALHNASTKYEDTYLEIERNIKRLIQYQKDSSNISKKYGDFFSFEFVTCCYDSSNVEEALEKISSVKSEIMFEERQEIKESFMQTLENKFEEAKEQYKSQQQK